MAHRLGDVFPARLRDEAGKRVRNVHAGIGLFRLWLRQRRQGGKQPGDDELLHISSFR
jgi:hypothetical protein